MRIVRTKQGEQADIVSVQKTEDIIKQVYSGQQVQPELASALPIFIENCILADFFDYTQDLIGFNNLSDFMMDAMDAVEKPTIISALLSAFSELDTTDVCFDTARSPHVAVAFSDGTRSIRMDTMHLEYTFGPHMSIEDNLASFRDKIKQELQAIIDASENVILFDVVSFLTVSDNFSFQIKLNIRLWADKAHKPNEALEKAAENYKANQETGEIEIDGEKQIPFYKEYWIGTNHTMVKDENDKWVKLSEQDENTQPKIGIKEPVGEYVWMTGPWQKGQLKKYNKPSLWNRFWTKVLLGATWVDYKQQ